MHIQWDPERTLRGASLEYGSIQVGLSRKIIEQYVNEWTVDIVDLTPTVRKIHALMMSGKADAAKRLLPPERVYSVSSQISKRWALGGN